MTAYRNVWQKVGRCFVMYRAESWLFHTRLDSDT